ncbi:hypothetical protein SAMN05920897_10630 [Alkalispirochaeta americana]|uniref:Uncharacterized protein n=1 Tax=Alkalispirochaeta americana TaxID=159291 RepID=A0A1N6RAT2_9SPIO|nr:hypothetical protein [Alkalispirochaeta americana]SIQ25935.1 hypothetical protein SAMN05920897_10630 [Alkalispirochaeta americana]
MKRDMGPRRVHEVLCSASSRVKIPLGVLASPPATPGTAGVFLSPPGGEPSSEGQGKAFRQLRGVSLAGGGQGLCAIIGEILAAQGGYGEVSADSGTFSDEEPLAGAIRLVLPASFFAWAGDRAILWRSLAGVAGSGQVEVRSVGVQEITAALAGADLSRMKAGGAATIWRCRMGKADWIVAPCGDGSEASLGRGMVRVRDILRGLGVPGELDQTRLDFSRISPQALRLASRFVQISSPGWRVFWPQGALERFLGELLMPGDQGDSEARPSFEALQRGAAVRICDRILRQGGLSRMVTAVPRTQTERQSRHALRTVEELLGSGGIAARTFAETAYRSGDHYRAMIQVVRGLPRSGREQLRGALGRRAWEQMVLRSSREEFGQEPWDAFCRACGLLAGDLERRVYSPGRRPPPVVAALVQRFFVAPRQERLQSVWQKQIASGRLARALEEARLSWLRTALQQLPRAVLVQAGCGDSSRVQMRISAAFSRRGRKMYLEDVAVLQEHLRRNQGSLREAPPWEELLISRQAVLREALRACPDRRVTPG